MLDYNYSGDIFFNLFYTCHKKCFFFVTFCVRAQNVRNVHAKLLFGIFNILKCVFYIFQNRCIYTYEPKLHSPSNENIPSLISSASASFHFIILIVVLDQIQTKTTNVGVVLTRVATDSSYGWSSSSLPAEINFFSPGRQASSEERKNFLQALQRQPIFGTKQIMLQAIHIFSLAVSKTPMTRH